MLIVNGAYSKKTEIQHSLNNSNNTFYCIDFLTGWYRTALNIMHHLKKLKKENDYVFVKIIWIYTFLHSNMKHQTHLYRAVMAKSPEG